MKETFESLRKKGKIPSKVETRVVFFGALTFLFVMVGLIQLFDGC